MARRTKEELQAANYYEWLADCQKLRDKKKDGVKLDKKEKLLMRTIPSAESPYVRESAPTVEAPTKKKKPRKVTIDFDKNVVWPSKGGYFLCSVFNAPFKDEQCLLFCEREDCPFFQIGYFRAHGEKF